MLWTIIVVLLLMWVLGFSMHIGGGLIHLLLVVGLVIGGIALRAIAVVLTLVARVACHL